MICCDFARLLACSVIFPQRQEIPSLSACTEYQPRMTSAVYRRYASRARAYQRNVRRARTNKSPIPLPAPSARCISCDWRNGRKWWNIPILRRSRQGCQDSARGLSQICRFRPCRKPRSARGRRDACDVALLSRKNCSVAAALFMTFRAFVEIIIIVDRERGRKLAKFFCLSCTFLMALGPNYPAHLTTRNPSTRSDRPGRRSEQIPQMKSCNSLFMGLHLMDVSTMN